MAKQIESLTFDVMRGSPIPPAEAVQVARRPGQDGATVMDIGLQPREAEIVTMKLCEDQAAAIVERGLELSLQGTRQTIVDARGESFTNCEILDVAPRVFDVVADGVAKVAVRTSWRVMQNNAE